MSSSVYSYFNPNNYQPILPSFSGVNAYDIRMLPSYAINSTQLMTYILVGITAATLGYVTIKGSQMEEAQSNKDRLAREAEQRQSDAEQAQREAEQKQREAEQRQREAENRTGGKNKKNKTNSNKKSRGTKPKSLKKRKN